MYIILCKLIQTTFLNSNVKITSAPKEYLKKVFVQTYAKLYNLRKFINHKRRGAKYFNLVYTVHFTCKKQEDRNSEKNVIKKYSR